MAPTPLRPSSPKPRPKNDKPGNRRHDGAPSRNPGQNRRAEQRNDVPRPARERDPDDKSPFLSPGLAIDAERLLEEVLRFDGAADVTVSRHFRDRPAYGHRVRGLIAEAIYTALRRRAEFSHYAASGVGRFERRLLLLALRENGVSLDGLATEGELAWFKHLATIPRDTLPAPVRANLPDWLYERLAARFGEAGALELAAALDTAAPLDLRVNRLESDRDTVMAQLAKAGPQYAPRPTPFAPDGIRLAGKPDLARLPLFEYGVIEVQDEGSQLLAQLLAPRRGEMVVDFCAGAGGKTLALGALMRGTGRLYAFDVSDKRLAKAKQRIAKSKLQNVQLVTLANENDLRVKRLAGKIDRVLVDAPCSGLGTLRRNPDLKWRQSPESVAEMNEKQRSILASAARLVKPGGRLVYATCSLLTEENEAIADAFLAAHPEFERLDAYELLRAQRIELPAGASPYLQLLPQVHGTDGFFAAAFERKADAAPKKPAARADVDDTAIAPDAADPASTPAAPADDTPAAD
ncbi:RsmB/NOP family class I SAM-dependent RNA methyltransferase [Derxia gummosa]|uniref:RsmB/NOP family class I SAM-dependent RNA methyltransferase n=1 Tax=Derxia gummosa DSM 723 TaxID=1121388 RepID=A0A8B6XAP3_9BURK|nr:RsmB/NOP family class I SAM-dependent RNA methyltransferase [Derxia gummosa]